MSEDTSEYNKILNEGIGNTKKVPGKITYLGGATRNNDTEHVRFDLCSPYALEEWAEVNAEGAKTHGDYNWLSDPGMPESVIWNHLENHLTQYRKGCRKEKHLGKAIWGLAALIHLREAGPIQSAIPHSPQSDTESPTGPPERAS